MHLSRPAAPAASMFQKLVLLVSLGCCLLGPRLGVQATGRQLLAATNTTGIYYDSSKDYMLLGCFPRDGGGREVPTTLAVSTPQDDTGMSVERCAALARAAHPTAAAFHIQASEGCMAGKRSGLPTLLTTARTLPEQTCEMQCSNPSAPDVSCGGTNDSVSVYVFKGSQGYTDLGCYVYNATGHPGSTDLTGPSAYKMTPAECYRLSAAYDIFGLVNGNRCIGFASVRQAAVAAAHDGSDSCQVRCTGAAAAMCGGKSSMQLYARNKPLPQLAPVSVAPNDYVYLGCVADQEEWYYDPSDWWWKAGRPGLPSLLMKSRWQYMDPTTCAAAAKRAGKRFFGLLRDTCRAGASLINAVRHSSKPGRCTTWCAPDYICRGGGKDPVATSLYVMKTGKDYTNLGCYALRPDRPPLPQLLLDGAKMTVTACHKKAAAYKFFAVFNGTRCYASNDLAPSLRYGRGSTGCTTPCGNSSKQKCGGAAAFMVYVNHVPQVIPAVPLALGPAGEVPEPVAAPSQADLQRQRLLEGRDALDPTWSSPCMADWTNTTYPCDGDNIRWRSVEGCTNGVVTDLLFMHDCWLYGGTLPPTWGARPGLEGLTFLSFRTTRLTGTLPAAWAGLASLHVLEAHENGLTGTLPEQWGASLQVLRLHANQLTGTLPENWARSPSLLNVLLGNNRLEGTLPAAWGNLTQLRNLELYNNTQLTGTLPATWGNLTSMEVLGLAQNPGLNGTIPCTWAAIGTNSTGAWSGEAAGSLRRLSLRGSTGVTGCYPSVGLAEAGEWSDTALGPTYGPRPVLGVAGVDPGCPPCP